MTNIVKRLADLLAKTPRRLWAVSFLLFFALGASWSISTPMGGSPDEHAHIVRAAAVARGQINGPEVMVEHSVAGIEGHFAETGVTLPQWYKDVKTVHECYAFDYSQPARCAPPIGHSEAPAQVTTAAGRYNPVYYIAVGWPSLLVDGVPGLYLMRLASAAICALLLASAVVSAAEWRRRSIAMLGLIAAATPMSLFMFGMVNPSGPEIAAGILVWSAMLPILMSPEPGLLNRRLARLGVSAIVLISIRPLGGIWFAGALVGGLVLQERSALRLALRRRATLAWGAVVATVAGAALAWTAAHPDHSAIKVPADLTMGVAARKTFDETFEYIKQMVGYFGWLDVPPPAWTLFIWTSVVVMLALLALCFARIRESVAVLGMVVGIILLPVVAQAVQVRQLGLVWQGRYLLPLAVGLPIMAAAICVKRSSVTGMPWRRLVAMPAVALAAANVVGFYWALRRNGVGIPGPLLLSHSKWAPPLGWEIWLVVYVLGAAGLTVLAMVGDRRPPAPAEEGEIVAPLRRPVAIH